MDGITKKQQAVLDCIAEFIGEKGYGPTVREICSAMGLSSPSTVHVHLKALEDKGMIHRDPLKSRSITLTAKARGGEQEERPLSEDLSGIASSGYDKVVNLPLVGQVAAGVPILAEENIEDTIALPVDIVGDSASFLLSVHGESMIEAGINDGDYLVVKEQSTANNGDIVVALIDDGATVKRFFKERDHIRLQPENSSMEPIITRDCSIVGKVVALFRRVY
ncbi:MAG: transcriptional repressor LexA [Eggerthellaceae bacterium]|jgi:repressor LexA